EAEAAIDLRELNGSALVGPGAAGVARAMAVTFFCRHRPPAELLLVGDDLLPGTPGARGISRVATVDSALAALGLTAEESDGDGDVDEREAPAPRRSSSAHLVLVSSVGDD